MKGSDTLRTFENIAKLIKEKRLSHANGYSQSELSALLGYKNGQFISNVERALCNIPFKMLNRVCEILDISEMEIKRAIMKDYEDTINNHLSTDKAKSFSNSINEALEESEVIKKQVQYVY